MTVLLAFATAITAGWIIDRLAFNGDLTAIIRDEIAMTRSRRKHAQKMARLARRSTGPR